MLDDSVKDAVRESTDIVDLIGSDLTLRRSGRNYAACCPWHDDRSPSLMVNPDRQSWKCWVCDVGGDVFAYVMKRDGCGFPDAVRTLAERAGISLKEDRRGPVRNRLYELLEWSAVRFQKELFQSPEAAKVRQYIKSRGLTPGAAREYRLGWSPDNWTWLSEAARRDGFTDEELIASGMSSAGKRGSAVDRFRDRLIFPIADESGKVVAFGGRILPWTTEKTGKYVNSPQTDLFSKSKILYGLNKSAEEIKSVGFALVMEGYTDVIGSHLSAIGNAVAVMGTALTVNHCRTLRKYTKRVVLVFDGDAAGIKRTVDCLPAFFGSDFEIQVATIPGGKDPAEYVAEFGGESFLNLCKESPEITDYLCEKCKGDSREAAEFIAKTLDVCAASRSQETEIRIEQTIAKLHRITGVSSDTMRRRVGSAKPAKEKEKEVTAVPRVEVSSLERDLFWCAFSEPRHAAEVIERVEMEWLDATQSQKLLLLLRELDLSGKELTPENAMNAAEDADVKSLIATSTEGRQTSPVECLRALERRYVLRNYRIEVSAISSQIGEEPDEAKAIDLLQSLVDRRKSRPS